MAEKRKYTGGRFKSFRKKEEVMRELKEREEKCLEKLRRS